KRARIAWGTGLTAAVLAKATGGMAMREPEGPIRMSGLRLEGLAGYRVVDRAGRPIGEIDHVEADYKGRTRFVHVDLDAGGEVKLASFRAWLDDKTRTISLDLPQDIVLRRAEGSMISLLSGES